MDTSYQVNKMSGKTSVIDSESGDAVMLIEAVLTLPPGSVIELPTGPSRTGFQATVRRVRLTPAVLNEITVILDCDVPAGWWDEQEMSAVSAQYH